EDFTALSADSAVTFEAQWEAMQSSGRIVGYVLFDGKSTPLSIIELALESTEDEGDITSDESDDGSNSWIIIGIIFVVAVISAIGVVWMRRR
ncbi:MAG: hypothetical protein GY855_05300, partial [candidate division Zixibacteria bacterium]|nr:hypothetical protein [candidate division Zixibacteria bacterium]